jgi:hypothetical protein
MKAEHLELPRPWRLMPPWLPGPAHGWADARFAVLLRMPDVLAIVSMTHRACSCWHDVTSTRVGSAVPRPPQRDKRGDLG